MCLQVNGALEMMHRFYFRTVIPCIYKICEYSNRYEQIILDNNTSLRQVRLIGGGSSWIRKGELAATGKCDTSLLEKYGDNDFVVDDDVVKKEEFIIEVIPNPAFFFIIRNSVDSYPLYYDDAYHYDYFINVVNDGDVANTFCNVRLLGVENINSVAVDYENTNYGYGSMQIINYDEVTFWIEFVGESGCFTTTYLIECVDLNGNANHIKLHFNIGGLPSSTTLSGGNFLYLQQYCIADVLEVMKDLSPRAYIGGIDSVDGIYVAGVDEQNNFQFIIHLDYLEISEILPFIISTDFIGLRNWLIEHNQ